MVQHQANAESRCWVGRAWSLSPACGLCGGSDHLDSWARQWPGGGLTPAPSPPGRYLYNRMGYWSDWPVPILVTTAAAFAYIAGLLVRGAVSEGRWPCSQGKGDWACARLMEGATLV